MQFHHGQRLNNLIEKSPLKVFQIVQKSGVAKSSLYDMFEKSELLYSKIEPILQVLKVSQESFYKLNTGNEMNDDGGADFMNENSQLRQIINLLKRQIEQQAEVITLLKKRKLTV